MRTCGVCMMSSSQGLIKFSALGHFTWGGIKDGSRGKNDSKTQEFFFPSFLSRLVNMAYKGGL